MRRPTLVILLLWSGLAAAGEPAGMRGMLDAHNAERAAAGVPPLRWSDAVATGAQAWADQLARETGCRMRHSGSREHGENLAWYFNRSPAPAEVAGHWAAERRWYDPAANTCQTGRQCGHYTQIVWRDSEWLGCGRARCGAEEIWVCRYTPPGNRIGRRPY